VHASAVTTQLPWQTPLKQSCEQQLALVWHAAPSRLHTGWHATLQNWEQHCADAVQTCPSGPHWDIPQVPFEHAPAQHSALD
jgi:hypothetical protein